MGRSLRFTILILLAIFFQLILFTFEQVALAEHFGQNNSDLNGSNIKFLNMNESLHATGWIDETGVNISMAQDHFIIGVDAWQNASTFKMIVIGDSIAWGAGLEQKEKYYYKLANWLQKTLRRPVDVIVLAHTGATLVRPQDISKIGHVFGNPDLSSWDPTILEQAEAIRRPDDVELILLSGGINDININTILNPLTDPDQIRSHCRDIEEPLQSVLIKLLSKCTNSKIIVTSYYPIVSNNTSESALNVFANELQNLDPNSIESLGFNIIKNLFGVKRTISMLSSNSNLFDNQSKLIIKRAVEQANEYSYSRYKEKRAFSAFVSFPSNRSYGTNESWLWELTDPQTNSGKLTNDHKYAYRVSLCQKNLCNWNDEINAIGHPNVDGANEFNRTIIYTISNTEEFFQ